LLIRRGEDALVALHDGSNGESHAGIAARPLDDGSARFEQTIALGVLDHPERHAVFDAVAGIEGFQLCVHVCRDIARYAV
jgi:hypothetical protein